MVHELFMAVAASGGSTTIEILGYVGIPLFLALVGGCWAGVKGLMRFTQFMARSESAQRSIADSNVEIRDKINEANEHMNAFAEKTNKRLGEHDQAIAVLNYVVSHNGNIPDGHELIVRKRTEEDK